MLFCKMKYDLKVSKGLDHIQKSSLNDNCKSTRTTYTLYAIRFVTNTFAPSFSHFPISIHIHSMNDVCCCAKSSNEFSFRLNSQSQSHRSHCSISISFSLSANCIELFELLVCPPEYIPSQCSLFRMHHAFLFVYRFLHR